jgi:mercuric ion transport protein
MTAKRRIDSNEWSDTGQKAALGIGTAALMIACCAGPAVVAEGALAAGGHFFRSPLVLIAGLVLAGAGAALALTRSHRGNSDCCPPPSATTVEDTSEEGRTP